jgi:protein FAM32A
MPSEEYRSVARGPLKLKGAAGVTKKKKKKDKTTDLEKNLSPGGDKPKDTPREEADDTDKPRRSDSQGPEHRDQAQKGEEEDEAELKTEAERRFAEAKRKRVRSHSPCLRTSAEQNRAERSREEQGADSSLRCNS